MDGREERQPTFSGENGQARFSPDGLQVVYTHIDIRMRNTSSGPRPEYGETSLWTVDVNGKHPRRVLRRPAPRVDICACWSPDGRRLAVAMNRKAGA